MGRQEEGGNSKGAQGDWASQWRRRSPPGISRRGLNADGLQCSKGKSLSTPRCGNEGKPLQLYANSANWPLIELTQQQGHQYFCSVFINSEAFIPYILSTVIVPSPDPPLPPSPPSYSFLHSFEIASSVYLDIKPTLCCLAGRESQACPGMWPVYLGSLS